MKKILILSGLLMLLTNALIAQIDEIEFEEYTLDNGLRVILHENHSTPLVAVCVYYHVGSKNEKADRTGFAHFFEHLMFEGSENIERGEFFQYIQNAGGSNNAYTSFDQTVYFESLPSNQLELGLWLESERLMHAKIDMEGVETQREVVKEERKLRLENQPYGSILSETFSHAYTEHPYQWTPIGDDQYIDQASLEEFMDFYNTYYVPNNAVLSIAGDIDIEETKKLVKAYFGSIKKGTKEMNRPTVKEPKQTAETIDTVYDNIQLPAVVQSYHIPERGSDDFYAIQMVTKLLSDGKSSRLYKRMVDEEKSALNVATMPFELEDPGLFLTFSIANMGVEPEKLYNTINEEIAKVSEELVSDEEFNKLKNQVENDFYYDKTRMMSLAQSLAEYKVFYGDANKINTVINEYMKVTKEDLRRVAKKYLRPENRSTLYYLPKTAN